MFFWQFRNQIDTKYLANTDSRGGFKGGGAVRVAAPIGSHFVLKSRFFPCKGIYFVVRVCDK